MYNKQEIKNVVLSSRHRRRRRRLHEICGILKSYCRLEATHNVTTST